MNYDDAPPAIPGCETCAARNAAGIPGACAQHQAEAKAAERAADSAALRERSNRYSEVGTYIGNETERRMRANGELRKNRDPLEPHEAELVYRLWDRAGRGRLTVTDPDVNQLANDLRRPAVTVLLWTVQLLGLETDGREGYKDIDKFSPYILDVWANGIAPAMAS